MYKDDAKVCNFADALLLAGVDYLVVGPKVLEELNSQYTMGGYNDGTPPPSPHSCRQALELPPDHPDNHRKALHASIEVLLSEG